MDPAALERPDAVGNYPDPYCRIEGQDFLRGSAKQAMN